MSSSNPPATRAGRPRKSSTAATLPPPLATTPVADVSTPSLPGAPVSMAPPSLSGSGPSTKEECEGLAAQLLDTSVTLRRRLDIASELRDSAESNRDFAFYATYLSVFIPALLTILGDEKAITFAKESADQRYRHTLLSFLQRLPHNEPYKAHEATVMELMVKLMKVENEENALICIKIMIDGFRAHKEQAEPFVEPFLDLVKQMYANTKAAVEKEFGSAPSKLPTSSGTSSSPAPPTPASDSSAQPPAPQASSSTHALYARALHSPKVLTECPIAVVLIFQTYKNVMAPAMLDFYPLVMESIMIQPEPQRLAHQEAKEKGDLFVGVANGIHNRDMYTELIKAQVKTMAFLAYVLRGSQNNNIKEYLDIFPEACVRLLRDCPPEDVATRKELLVATRHILTVDSRSSFVPYIDVMLDENVLVGTGITCRESLRPLAFSVVADLIHHVRNELNLAQLSRVVQVFSFNLNDATFSGSIQTMCAKLLNTIIESIHKQDDRVEAARIMRGMYITSLEKLEAFNEAHDRLKAISVRDKGKGKARDVGDADGDVPMLDGSTEETFDKQISGWREIERNMPIYAVAYAEESLDTYCREGRYLFKTLLHTFRSLLTFSRQEESVVAHPDGELLGRFFLASLRSLAIFEGLRDPREGKEAVELLSQILLSFEAHEFSEIWTTHMALFIDMSIANPGVFPVLQMLITHESVSHQLVGILLKHLMSNLGDLGESTSKRSQLTLGLFKRAFLAINNYISTNEIVLVPHLQKLIMDSFAHAAKAKEPLIYYQILRALFRSIGGGRFEALYKEVLPILQEMLDTLAYLLKHATEETYKDLFTELTLTVPVRLTNLLPHLSYLMQPLVHALQSNPDLVSQGLRTLELCIDNLTADFLDPTMGPVLSQLMDGLQRLLKPVPANRNHAHAAVKILGKLGGRNRKFQEVDLAIPNSPPSLEITIPIVFEGKCHALKLGPLIATSRAAIAEEKSPYAEDGLQLLMNAALSMLAEDAPNPEGNPFFSQIMAGLFLACNQTSLAATAEDFVRKYCQRAFAAELGRQDPSAAAGGKYSPDLDRRRRFLPLTTALADAFIATLSDAKHSDLDGLGTLLATIIGDFRVVAARPEYANEGQRSVDRMVQTFAHRFVNMCHEEDWSQKTAAVTALHSLLTKADLPRKLIIDLQVDITRVMLFCLRDAPKESPQKSDSFTDMMKHLIRTCQAEEDGRHKLNRLIDSFVCELNSQSELCREACHECLDLLAETLSQSTSELVELVAKQRILDANGPVFSKPLRALPFPMQVGNIDAVTWLMSLRPVIIEFTEEFIRLLHEVLALADVEDNSLLGKSSTHKLENWLKTLRISCIKLLRAAMATPDFLNKPNLNPVRSRIIQVYFKHVYSAQLDIVQVAFDGLREVTQQQAKLPKEVLQSGLRPILVNLADAKRLSVSGLDGLARFLELLNNYFKVEIGIKLIDHFEVLGDSQMLAKAALSPLSDNPDITRMAKLVNIFRLLPSSASQFLTSLVSHVVDVEGQLHQTVPGPFTENLAKYLNKYHEDAVQNLIDNIRNPRHVWTYRNMIACGEAPQLVQELSVRAEELCKLCFNDPENFELVMPGLYLMRELARTSPTWLIEREEVVLEKLVGVWRAILAKSRTPRADMSNIEYQQMPPLLLELFIINLRQQQHIPLLSHVVEAFEIRSSFERSFVTFFLYEQVALQDSVEYRRDILEYFLNLYEEESVSWAFKTNMLRVIINPTLRIYFADKNQDGSLISSAFVQKITQTMWRPLAGAATAKQREDALLIEIFNMTTMLVQHADTKVSDARKDIFKFAWMGINLLEPTVKLTAYVLTAQFMAVYETPNKFIRLTWIGLLRLKESETRTLYREALKILAGCLPKIEPPSATNMPDWAQKVRGILIEEGQTTNQLVTVCELLVNHPDLFYECRELYVPCIANSLNKLAFVQTANMELRKLSVDIVELIFQWERRRIESKEAEIEKDPEAMDVDETSTKRIRAEPNSTEPSPPKRQRVDRAGTAASTSSGGGWAAPGQVRELITAHLLRLVSSSSDPVQKGGMTKRALDLFKQILGPKGLPNVHVKLNFFHRTMTQDVKDDTFNMVANSAEVIAAIAASKDQQWIRANLGTLTKLLEKIWVSEEPVLHEIVEPLSEAIFQEMPEDDSAEGENDGKALYTFVQTSVIDGLAAGLRSSSALPGTLFLLRLWLKVQPGQLQTDAISTGLLKVLANLVKIHTSNGPDPTYRFIISILDIVRDRTADLKEQRKHLQSILSTLIERSSNVNLCRYLLDLMRHWVLDDPEPTSQGKEKASLLRSMAVFEQRDDPSVFEKYLDLIFDIYELDTLRGTEITHRLEPCFLLGARSSVPAQRARFLNTLEQSLPRTLDDRLQYLFSLQNWDYIANSYWIPQILSMLLGIADHREPLLRRAIPKTFEEEPILVLAKNATASQYLLPARSLIQFDNKLAGELWIAIFPMCWASLTRSQQSNFTPYVVKLLSKEYHRKQIEMRPNVIETFLDGALMCSPPITLPPLLVKFLAKTFNAWYIGFEILTKLSDVYRGDDVLRESCATALSELYAELCEDDMFYGLARSRCVFPETTAALTYEQDGQWPKAIEMYEQAQIKARNGLLPFSEDEYCFWEDHWVLAAQKLQNWEALTELARQDNDSDLLLEAAWRLSDWGSSDREMIEASLNRVIDVPTPRRKTFEAFTALLKAHTLREPPNDFVRVLDEAQQVSLRKWISLPSHMTFAHVPLLQMFQQCVELGEAAQVFDSLHMTNQANLEMRVTSDLKQIFQTWRDRLPNFWDDISVWSDLLAWRQHVFTAVTKVYVPLIPAGETGTHGYRGYHEQAWMINRFGEVARRHGLLDVCSIALNKIYSLPNIEISEAFLKLREQALCFFQKPDKFNDGLENISTTNLMYFSPPQKAEFLTLKGMFISRLGQNEDANSEFAHAIQMDMTLPKAWAEWGKFNDKLYRDRPEFAVGGPPEPEPGKPKLTDEQWQASYSRDRAVLASSAVSCYLQAAGLYNNHKSRALLLRVLWLLGLDDSQFTIAKAFENFKGDLVIWYWITLIPQLLLSLSHREAKQARNLLMKIAKSYPQALFYHLRVSREDFGGAKRQHLNSRAAAARKANEAAKAQTNGSGPDGNGEANGGNTGTPKADNQDVKDEANGSAPPEPVQMAPPQAAPTPRQPWELVEEIMNMLKSASPLLALTMEKMVDQISIRAKPSSDEDIYRFFAALLNDAMQQWSGRNSVPNDDGELSQMTKENLAKFANNLNGDLKAAIENDFMKDMPKLREYIGRLQYWRDMYERSLDSRPRSQPLDQGGCNLIEFHHTKFDDIEVPGQYAQHIDAGEELVKILRFSPKAELGRGHGHCFRRITMIGSNGSLYTFNVQMPAARHCRREERLTQLFRIMNSVLKRRKEARRRNLQFHVPTAIALAPQLRLVQNDSSYVSLQDVFDDYCQSKGMSREDSIMASLDRLKQLIDPAMSKNDPKFLQLKIEVMEEIQTKMIPETILTNYMIRTMHTSEGLWLMRKQFALQTATVTFLTYVCCLSNRTPSRFHFSRTTGLMYMTEILPAFAQGQAIISSAENAPFRLTPNMQNFITRPGIEGVVTAATTAIAKSLVAPEFDLAGTLSLFIRDEILTWQNTYMKEPRTEMPLTSLVYKNVESFIKRASLMGYIGDNKDKSNNAAPAFHAIVNLISQATSPACLAQMGESFMAWY